MYGSTASKSMCWLLVVLAGSLLASCRGCRGGEEEGKAPAGKSVTQSPARPVNTTAQQQPTPDPGSATAARPRADKKPAERKGLYELRPGVAVPVGRGIEIDPARLPPKAKDPVRVYRTMTALKQMQKNFPPPPPASQAQAANNPQHEAGARGVPDERSKEYNLVKRRKTETKQRGSN